MTDRAIELFARYGVLLAIVATFAVFSLLKPESFFTFLTLKGILRDSVPLVVVSLGVTAVLVMNKFDLSVGGLVSLSAVVVVVLMSSAEVGLGLVAAIVITLALGTAIGLGAGAAIAYIGLPSFILTIALGTVYQGAGLQITESQSVFEGIPESFSELGTGTIFGFSNLVYIGLAIVIIMYLLLQRSETGRFMYAIDSNQEAARLSGVPVRLLTMIGFGIVGLSAAIAGILINAQAGASNPNTGLGLLLPAYAAAFLGSSMFRVGQFTAIGTAIGAVYLQMIGTGLTQLAISGPLVQIIQGGILVAAIVLARLVQGRAKE
ncbi:MAG: ABC transporter permease [Solirubrobacterales bacterium]